MLPHYCIITKLAIIVSFLKPKYFVQDLMGRAIYFGNNHDHKSSVQRNNNSKRKKSYFYQPDSSEQLPYCNKTILKTI